jgi:hypothetical protein
MTRREKNGGRFGVVARLLLTGVFVAAAGRAMAAELATYKVHMLPLPGATPAGVTMDYIAFDPATHSVWAPAGNTGLVAVIDATNESVRKIEGFPTAEMGSGERKRVVGPSSVTIGEGTV